MSAAAKVMKRSGVVGPRPQPLSLPAALPSKRPRASGGDGDAVRAPAGPVIVYEHTPRVVHARPDEFKALVQRLTGQQRATGDQEPVLLLPAAEPAPSSSSSQEEERTAAGDTLVLTLGQQAPPPLDDRTSAGLLSPGAGFLLSPGSLLFSLATMQAIQELISS
ncbi:hypothetical protein PVAP13_2NG045300 [Panicum virgatum]|uniref:VQ domain-containing protein n=1 Tax=Panicum virgatum TaxID=38727 RepID=A0A8T0VBM4_PANVG|nr:hypothetical protein PVAP13_2NG045300 [Panicum virgatum]